MTTFEKRAVAFLDVLGFKDLIIRAEQSRSGLTELVGLRAILDDHVRFDNGEAHPNVPLEMQPRYLFVSDSIILSSPAQGGGVDGLEVVMLKTIQIAQKMFEAGHLVRGGVALGNVWHDERNIFGTAYIEAFQTEQKAKHPRVILGPSAVTAWRSKTRFMAELCLNGSDNSAEVALLHHAYVRSASVGYELFYNQVRGHILSKLETFDLGSDARAKWEWMVQFFNDSVKRHGIGTKPD